MAGPKAPKDPTKKRQLFYIMRNKDVAGSPQPNGSGTQFIYLNDGRLLSSCKVIGQITDESMLELLKTTEGFRKVVHSIGISVTAQDPKMEVDFVLQMYGKKDTYGGGTQLRKKVPCDGSLQVLDLEEQNWALEDDIPGQIRVEFEKAGQYAQISVCFYLQEGFNAPEPVEEHAVDFSSPYYQKMLEKSLLLQGNTYRLKKAINKAKNGEDVTIAFIGGSITQGAGAIPINTECYAYKTFQGLCALAGKGTKDNIHYCKAGVGGTPSELGMLRYEREILEDEAGAPDIVVVEFAVNDAGDETGGECYDSLVRKIFLGENEPAVVLLFAVFEDDWNLQDRLKVVGETYQLPMVSTKDTVVEQFYQPWGGGKVISKSQFFYDCYHPTNLGHTIMADGLCHLFQVADQMPYPEKDIDLSGITPPIGGDFTQVKLLSRNRMAPGSEISCGSFFHEDKELQGVERNMDLGPTMEFADNWMYKGLSEGKVGVPFTLEITCKALLLVYKDSGSPKTGIAEVFVDGEKALTVDPKEVGWTHCNALICFRQKETKRIKVEVAMKPGEEDKEFTILGFGYVE